MAVLLDSGFLLASLNSTEAEHQATIAVLESIREPIILPIPAITEVAYLLRATSEMMPPPISFQALQILN